MTTLEDVYGGADMMIIHAQHPNWDFYRNNRGFLCCRIKSQTKKEAERKKIRLTSPQNNPETSITD